MDIIFKMLLGILCHLIRGLPVILSMFRDCFGAYLLNVMVLSFSSSESQDLCFLGGSPSPSVMGVVSPSVVRGVFRGGSCLRVGWRTAGKSEFLFFGGYHSVGFGQFPDIS